MGTAIVADIGTIGVGLIGSVVWLWLLRRIRPRIRISGQIAEKVEPDLGPSRYYIKVSNLSRRAAVDLEIELAVLHLKRAANGEIYAKTVIRIHNTLPHVLPGRHDGRIHGHVLRLAVQHDLRAELERRDSTVIQLRIYARDELSGMGKVFETRYVDADSDIVQGAFSPGETYEIH